MSIFPTPVIAGWSYCSAMITRLITAALLLIALPTMAAAQTTGGAETVSVPPVLGRTVKAHMANGSIEWSRVHMQDADTLMIGRVRVRVADIRSLEVSDPTADGAWKGLAVGTAVGVMKNKASGLTAPLVLGAVGAVFGWAADALTEHFEPVALITRRTVSVAPTATLHSIGFNGTVRW